jgi:uncharacterized membrane protein
VNETRLRTAIAGLALVGAGIAAYLTYARYAHVTIACSTGGCETVQSSRYAVVAGIPVAALGLAGYLLIAGSALLPGEPGAAAGMALTLVGLAFSGYLIYAQVSLIGALCQWCLASDGVMTAVFALSLARARTTLREPRPGRAGFG